MKTATVRDLRNRYKDLLAWLAAGQEIVITQRGKAIARLVPAQPETTAVDWSQSPAVRRDRSSLRGPAFAELPDLLAESSGKW